MFQRKVVHFYMIYKNIEFFDICELRENEDGGRSLLRFPSRNLKDMFSEYSASCCKGAEIRFVSDSARLELTVSADDDAPARVIVYRGDYYIKTVPLTAKEKTVIELESPERFGWVERDSIIRKRFSPDVWRVILDSGLASFHSLETFGGSVRPPRPDEVPAKKWLAYGSSITCGEVAFMNTSSYVQQAAYRLGVDALNKGCSGACASESVTADFFSGEDWDFITLELGVNMRNVIAPDEFESRTVYMIDKLLKSHPGRKIFVITILPNHSIRSVVGSVFRSDHIAFNDILVRLCETRYKDSSVVLIRGEELLPDFCGLSSDLIHPSDYGHMQIGERLAEIIRGSGAV